jgi:hypothetical protein
LIILTKFGIFKDHKRGTNIFLLTTVVPTAAEGKINPFLVVTEGGTKPNKDENDIV